MKVVVHQHIGMQRDAEARGVLADRPSINSLVVRSTKIACRLLPRWITWCG
jgi:hypothetical protein